MKRSCALHPSYSPSRPPRTDCEPCWAAYGRKRAIDDGLRSIGRAKGGGQSSKKKGRAFMVQVAWLLRAALDLDEDDVYVKATSQIGCDLHLSPKALQRFPFSIEGKCQETLSIWAALKQAESNATLELPPILFFRRAETLTYVALRFTDFVRFLWPRAVPSLPAPEQSPQPETPAPTPSST